MSNYDYKKAKKRIEEILDNKIIINEEDKIPEDSQFSYDEGYYNWVGTIFVNLRDSSIIFADKDKEKILKIMRSFTSEIIEILREGDLHREIGIREDSVYAIYSTPTKGDVYEVYQKIVFINTYIKMLNKLLSNKGYESLRIGIGGVVSKELTIKAERKGLEMNTKLWVGDSIKKAYDLSTLGGKDGSGPICISSTFHYNIKEKGVESNGEKFKEWFKIEKHLKYGEYFSADLLKSNFSEWIDQGMQEADVEEAEE
ncbi:MAG: adenylate cyclase [Bacilli bacterium]